HGPAARSGRKTSLFSMVADCADMRMTLSADWQHVINVNAPVAKVLNEGGAAALILDQNRWLTAGGTVPPVIQLDHLALERWELEAVADHIKQKIEPAIDPPHGADRVIGQLRRFGRGIPGNHDLIELYLADLIRVVPGEPSPVDHVAAGRHRRL